MCKIGIIDSGAGGITTLSKILKLLPNEEYIYVADCSNSPYGNKSSQFIYNRLYKISLYLIQMDVKAIVIACNTATAACIDKLRKSFNKFEKRFCKNNIFTNQNEQHRNEPSVIFVGVEPAIKPAINNLTFGKALVLVTPATAVQKKFLLLKNSVNSQKLIISPQKNLASLIESNLNNLSFIKDEVKNILIPLKNKQIQSVVLGCTHYCLIKKQIQDIFKTKVFDGNIGVANRLHFLLKKNKLITQTKTGSVKFINL